MTKRSGGQSRRRGGLADNFFLGSGLRNWLSQHGHSWSVGLVKQGKKCTSARRHWYDSAGTPLCSCPCQVRFPSKLLVIVFYLTERTLSEDAKSSLVWTSAYTQRIQTIRVRAKTAANRTAA